LQKIQALNRKYCAATDAAAKVAAEVVVVMAALM